MKRLFLLLFLFTNGIFAQKTDASIFNLKGKVKEVKYFTNNALVKIIEFNEQGTIKSVKLFNLGKLVSKSENKFDPDGFKTSGSDGIITTHYRYDNLHNIIEITNLNASNNDTLDNVRNQYEGKNLINSVSYDFRNQKKQLTQKTLFFYNDSGLLVKEINYGISAIIKRRPYKDAEDKAPITYFYVYDDSKNLLKKTGKDELGNITSGYYYKYDSRNNKTEYQTYYPNNTASRRETFTYDERNNMIENSQYDSVGTLVYTDIYDYDTNNNLLKRTHYYKGEVTTATEFQHDSNGNCIEEKRYIKGKPADVKKKKFDTVGNEVSLKTLDASGKTVFESKCEITYY